VHNERRSEIMTIRDLITRNRMRKHLPERREQEHPIVTLQRQMNQLFDSLFHGGEAMRHEDIGIWRPEFSPQIDVKETETAIEITAELPGMDERDIDVSLDRDILILKGEKKEEKEEKDKNYWHVERCYGSFHRSIPLPEQVEKEKIEAAFQKGVLHITVPKTTKATPAGKKIAIKSGE